MSASVRVQIPYLPERREELERTVAAFHEQEGVRVNVLCLTGSSWGGAHNALLRAYRFGLERGEPADYILTGCDDAVPRPGALEAAVAFHRETGDLPGVRFFQDGAPLDPSYDAKRHGEETPWTRFFCAPPEFYQEIGAFLDLSWYTDIDYCQRIREAGHRIRMVDGYSFDHLDAPRTWAADGEAERQHAVYRKACADAKRSPLV